MSLTDTITVRSERTGKAPVSRDEAAVAIRRALRQRSGRSWSVIRGQGSVHGWLTITSPPSRQLDGCMTDEDRQLLGLLLELGAAAHAQGVTVEGDSRSRAEYVARAEGRRLTVSSSVARSAVQERCPSVETYSGLQCRLETGHTGFCRASNRLTDATWPTSRGLEAAREIVAEEAAGEAGERAA